MYQKKKTLQIPRAFLFPWLKLDHILEWQFAWTQIHLRWWMNGMIQAWKKKKTNHCAPPKSSKFCFASAFVKVCSPRTDIGQEWRSWYIATRPLSIALASVYTVLLVLHYGIMAAGQIKETFLAFPKTQSNMWLFTGVSCPAWSINIQACFQNIHRFHLSNTCAALATP